MTACWTALDVVTPILGRCHIWASAPRLVQADTNPSHCARLPSFTSPRRPEVRDALAQPCPSSSLFDALDNPVYLSLTGPHRHLALSRGRALRYLPDVARYVALPQRPDQQAWADLAALAGPGAVLPLSGVRSDPPGSWDILSHNAGVQMVDDGVQAAPDGEAVRLTSSDVPEMLALVAQTKPGPFLPRTVDMGTYLGIRRRGRLVAMAGERLHPPGWTEISAVCTAVGFRGQGLATRLVHAVADQIRQRGETPFLNAAASNVRAISLYESLGFRLRRSTSFVTVRVPS
jgi:ribosomal protein S18 acetylase RimI-like enzyme